MMRTITEKCVSVTAWIHVFLCVIWYIRSSCVLCSCLRTGTNFYLHYQSSSCVWKPTQIRQSLCHQFPLLRWSRDSTKKVLLILQRLQSPIGDSASLLLWLLVQPVTLWKTLVYILPWKPVSYILEVGIAMTWPGCKVFTSMHSHPWPLFYSPDKEIVNVTLDFLSGNNTHTCLTISAPVHQLPTSL